MSGGGAYLKGRGLPRGHLGGDREDTIDVEMLSDESLDQLDLLSVGRVRLHEEVVDLGRDDVGVLPNERREQVRLADRGENGVPRPVAARQDEPDRRLLVAVDARGALV